MVSRLLTTGPGNGTHVVILAQGSGMPMDAPPLETIAKGLGGHGIDVVRFEFPFMAARRNDGAPRSPDDDSSLAAHFAKVVAEISHPGRLVLAGWSLGGRIAVLIAPAIDAVALACLSYPFHPIGQPNAREALDDLRRLELPVLIIQGTRDAFGNREQIRGYRLAARVRVHWMEDGNHALQPRAQSGFTQEQQMSGAIPALGGFILDC